MKNKSRKSWPNFMISNSQFKPLALELQSLVDKCLDYNPDTRPTADELVKLLSEVCYIYVPRIEGTVTNLIQSGYSGFANCSGETIFFSRESVYGQRSPSTAANNKICLAKFSGAPRDRGHPIVVID